MQLRIEYFERFFLPVVKYTPLISPLGKGGYKGGEAKASQGGTTENVRLRRIRRGESENTLFSVQSEKFVNNPG